MSQASPIAIERPRPRGDLRFLLVAGRVVLGGIFLYAAYAKLHFNGSWHLGDYSFLFAMGIDSYKMVPLSVVVWMAKVLPWVEVLVGAMLVIGVGVRWAALTVTGLLVMFMIALTHAALGGLEINCGCFGNNSVKPSHELFLDAGLLAVALAVTVGGFFSRTAGKSQA